MPQMSPIFWTPMLIMTTAIIIQINSMNKFSELNIYKKKKNKNEKKNINWMW